MDNVNCRNCGKSISRRARSCPDCGHPQGLLAQTIGISPKTAFRYLLEYPFGLFFLIVFVGFLADKPRHEILETGFGLALMVHVLGWGALIVKAFVKPDK